MADIGTFLVSAFLFTPLHYTHILLADVMCFGGYRRFVPRWLTRCSISARNSRKEDRAQKDLPVYEVRAPFLAAPADDQSGAHLPNASHPSSPEAQSGPSPRSVEAIDVPESTAIPSTREEELDGTRVSHASNIREHSQEEASMGVPKTPNVRNRDNGTATRLDLLHVIKLHISCHSCKSRRARYERSFGKE